MLGRATFKQTEDDFLVEEDLGFEPSGDGEHCFLSVEKRGMGSNEAAGAIATRLGLRKRLVSHCGLKDLRAVTRQWFSVHLPGQASPEPADVDVDGLRVLRVTRNLRKLRRGVHRGNRFEIVLRDCAFGEAEARERWGAIAAGGAPNYFGEQRFGRDGGNVVKARRLFAGELEVRDRLLRGLFLSAARSAVFNAVIAERVRDGSWGRPLGGEVFGFPDNRSLVLPERVRGDEASRFEAGELELTAPLWGGGEPLSAGEVRELEVRVAAGLGDLCAGLETEGLRQERRVMRVRPRDATLRWASGTATVAFGLPKGAYATTVLRELADLG